VKRIKELGTTSSLSRNWSMLLINARNVCSYKSHTAPLTKRLHSSMNSLYSEFLKDELDIVIASLGIIHCLFLYLKHYVSENGFCLSFQVESTQLGSIDRSCLCFRKRLWIMSRVVIVSLIYRLHKPITN
jgi:hypothetical protein